MPDPARILRASTGELYRYRLAAAEQVPRIRVAVEAAQEERKVIEEASYELLFAPSMSLDAFEAQLQAIHDRDIPFVWRLKSEVEFLMTAVYGILTMARTIHRLAEGELKRCVKQALDAFEVDAPDADVFRHIHVHPETYLLGEGRSAERLPAPTSEGAISLLDDEGPVYFIGGKLFMVWKIAHAAETLAAQVAACRPAGD